MREFLRSLSLNTLGILIIVAALIVMVVTNPPVTICDAEVETFVQGTRGFLFTDPKANIYEPLYIRDRDICRDQNTPGACVRLFRGLKKMLDESTTVSQRCWPRLAELPQMQALFTSMDIMIRAAWGKEPPATPAVRVGWLSPSDVYLFCRLKARAQQIFGEEKWQEFQESYFTSLPGAQGLTRQQFWEKSLLSINCNSL